MGQLFWKFFLFFWLAQMITATGVGVTVRLTHTARALEDRTAMEAPPQPPTDAPPPLGSPYLFGGRPPAPLTSFDGKPPPPHRMPYPLPPVLPLLTGSFVSLVFAWLLAWYFARPIRNLRAAFGSVAGGQLNTRIGSSMADRRDELADLGKDFDHMAGQLQSLIDAQRRLLHDVSHELRSPLARLQAAADLMRQQPERNGEFAQRIQRDTARMSRLVTDLLTLARIDAGMVVRKDEVIDMREIAISVADDARIEAEAKSCTVERVVVESTPVLVKGNPELLASAIENIVRNGIRHSPACGRIGIAVGAQHGRVRISVSDNGPGVAGEDLDRIFEPFIRSHPKPNDNGFGLGLAITHRITEAHGGRVFARNRIGGGLLLVIDLPQA